MYKLLFASLIVMGASLAGTARADEPAPIRTLEGLKNEKLLSFAPAGTKLLVTSSPDDKIKLWDTSKAGAPVIELRHHQLKGLQQAIVCFTPRKKLIAASYTTGGTVVWDAAQPKELPRRVSLDALKLVGFLRDGKLTVRADESYAGLFIYGTGAAKSERKGLRTQCPEEIERWFRERPRTTKIDFSAAVDFYYDRAPLVSPDGKWAALIWTMRKGFADSRTYFLSLIRLDDGVIHQEDCRVIDYGDPQFGLPTVGFTTNGNLVVFRSNHDLQQTSRLDRYRITKRGKLEQIAEEQTPSGSNAVDGSVAADGQSVLEIQKQGDRYRVVRRSLQGVEIDQTEPIESDLESPRILLAPDGLTFAMTARGGKVHVYQGPRARIDLEPAPPLGNEK